MTVKTLSVSQPWATYICAGLKDVENRNYNTPHRGRLLIHVPASEKGWSWPDDRYLPPSWQDEYDEWVAIKGKSKNDMPKKNGALKFWKLFKAMLNFYEADVPQNAEDMAALEVRIKEKGFFMPSGAIVGECVIVDSVKEGNSESEWRQNAGPNTHHWILESPILYEKPITNVIGKQRLWDFDMTDIDYAKPLAL